MSDWIITLIIVEGSRTFMNYWLILWLIDSMIRWRSQPDHYFAFCLLLYFGATMTFGSKMGDKSSGDLWGILPGTCSSIPSPRGDKCFKSRHLRHVKSWTSIKASCHGMDMNALEKVFWEYGEHNLADSLADKLALWFESPIIVLDNYMDQSQSGTIVRKISSGDLFTLGAAGVKSALDAAGVREDDDADADGSSESQCESKVCGSVGGTGGIDGGSMISDDATSTPPSPLPWCDCSGWSFSTPRLILGFLVFLRLPSSWADAKALDLAFPFFCPCPCPWLGFSQLSFFSWPQSGRLDSNKEMV